MQALTSHATLARFTAAAVLLATVPATASDYSHTCVSADGRYVMDDGVLLDAAAYKAGDYSHQITFTTRHEKVHSLEEGYCIDWKRSQGNKGIGFEAKRYTLTIAFTRGGEAHQTELRCALYADGSPASYNCDRKVVTKRIGAPERDEKGWGVDQEGDEKPVITAWTHNGSDMELRAQGEMRTFNYVRPRSALEPNGVYPGTTLFSGTSDGRAYIGTSRIFTERCGELSFKVAGPIELGGSRVALRGRAPKPGGDCRPAGWSDQTLIFDLEPGR